MRGLFSLIILLAIVVAIVGYFRGWFTMSTSNSPEQSNVTVTVDKARLEEDKQQAMQKIEELKGSTTAPATPPEPQAPQKAVPRTGARAQRR